MGQGHEQTGDMDRQGTGTGIGPGSRGTGTWTDRGQGDRDMDRQGPGTGIGPGTGTAYRMFTIYRPLREDQVAGQERETNREKEEDLRKLNLKSTRNQKEKNICNIP